MSAGVSALASRPDHPDHTDGNYDKRPEPKQDGNNESVPSAMQKRSEHIDILSNRVRGWLSIDVISIDLLTSVFLLIYEKPVAYPNRTEIVCVPVPCHS